jgi:hypothetical protein
MNDILKKPITANEIEWRVQQQTSTGKLIVVPYITNRCVMERFDEAFGASNWTSEFREIANGFICRLSVTIDKKFVYREDGASKTNIEPEKGGISDAMKRAAVQFGLGRCLYAYPRVMIETDGKFIPDWAYAKLDKLVEWVNAGNYKEIIIIPNK